MDDADGFRILIADDDAVVRTMISALLTRNGHDVTVVSDGTEAWSALEKDAYSLLVIDHNMPGAMGGDIIRRLRARGDAMPVIFISSEVEPKLLESILKLGDVKFLPKPVSGSTLREAIREIAPKIAC